MEEDNLKKIIREGYSKVVKQPKKNFSCCGTSKHADIESDNVVNKFSTKIGYSTEELNSVPEGSNLGLGCGNPTAHASIKVGETVLDLGSGAGFDCFLAAKKVGKSGKVIGVDMTPAMIDKARENAKKSNYNNIEFRLGEIENLPVSDSSVDLIISNCVINLSPNKDRVLQEAHRVLKSGGRLTISDIVLLKELPDFVVNSINAYIGCVSGAILKEAYIEKMKKAGFKNVEIISQTPFPTELLNSNPTIMELVQKANVSMNELKNIANSVVSVKIAAYK